MTVSGTAVAEGLRTDLAAAPEPVLRRHRLLAPPPGWTRHTDVVVVGSGVAGLATALAVRRAAPELTVLIVSKSLIDAGATRWAQGGVAAAVGVDDSPDEHRRDTVTAGVGLCDESAVAALVTEGPAALRALAATGARFDTGEDGGFALTREGGHRRYRIAHAGGDATGAEISRALCAALALPGTSRRPAGVQVIEHALALDLVVGQDGAAAGVTFHVLGEGEAGGVGAVRARAVVLATGGLGQLFSSTTNPGVSTGDGVALALRAGAEVCDLEFVQFHPTVLWLGARARGHQPLISEAVRGEGAHLVDAAGRAFMADAHPMADLAPRDVVARASVAAMAQTGADHVYLDGRHLGETTWRYRFPTVLATCRRHGIDPVRDLIPVAPAAHYASGGVCTDLTGRTNVPALYACGEVACTGVHGANRLASNSLLEGLVFAERVAADVVSSLPPPAMPGRDDRRVRLLRPDTGAEVRAVMSADVGVRRSAAGLRRAAYALAAVGASAAVQPSAASWEVTNMHLVASALLAAATRRAETRGSHWRTDHPATDDRWRGHLVTVLDDDGLRTRFLRQQCDGDPTRSAGPDGRGKDG